MSTSFRATCTECGAHRVVRRHELLHAAYPRCLRCGGRIELSAAAQEDLADIQAQKATGRKGPQQPGKPGRRGKPAPEPTVRIIPKVDTGRHQWGEWPDMYRWTLRDAEKRGQDLRSITPSEFYASAGAMASTLGSRFMTENEGNKYAGNLVRLVEGQFYEAGRPYYKIWPAISSALCDTEMRVDGEHFHCPQGGFEIRLAKDDNPLSPLTCALVARVTESLGHQDGRAWSLVLVVFDNVEEFWLRDNAGHYWVSDIPIRPGLSLEDALDQTDLMRDCPNPDLMRRLMRVIVGTCFFAVDHHEAILPDLPRRVIDAYRISGRQPTLSEAAEELGQAKREGLFGWRVGSEMVLPTAVRMEDRAEDGQPGAGHKLTSGHIRRGHLRMQPCGEKQKERKLIFVPPTVVRPDLPLSGHGYQVRIPRGVHWERGEQDD
ncbi:MAG: hypothetical protein KGL39_35815 [Patescibacteria group bacterium]|nr:hypothetical protein [Patescibacteria group bacterium]